MPPFYWLRVYGTGHFSSVLIFFFCFALILGLKKNTLSLTNLVLFVTLLIFVFLLSFLSKLLHVTKCILLVESFSGERERERGGGGDTVVTFSALFI